MLNQFALKMILFTTSIVDISCGTNFDKNSYDYANARESKRQKNAFFDKKNAA